MATLFRNIVVPHDLSPTATQALKVAASLVRTRGHMLVLHVVSPYPITGLTPGEMPYIPPIDLESDAKRQLELTVKKALPRRPGFRVTTRVVMGDPADAIVAAAKKADSIVMATQGRTGLAHLILGSVAEKVVRNSPRPVLTLRPGAARRKPTARRR